MAEGFSSKIRSMFDSIAPTYDVLNRINTLGLDILWRKDLVNQVAKERPARILDLAAGTGDLSVLLARACKKATVIAGDMSIGMLKIAKEKAEKEHLSQIKIMEMDALRLPFAGEEFDAITCAFGVRNFGSIAHGYQEMYRVLRPGGMVAILELCEPQSSISHGIYDIHVYHVMPLLGSIIGHNKSAYEYLAKSIEKVPQREEMSQLMEEAGFIHTYHKVYFPSVCALYVGYKPLYPGIRQHISDLSKLIEE